MPPSQQEHWREIEGDLFRLVTQYVQGCAMFVVDPQGGVRQWNPAAERLLGYSEQEVLGQTAEIFFASLPPRLANPVSAAENADDDEVAKNHHGWLIRKDGSRFWGASECTPLASEDGGLRGVAVFLQDLTPWRLRDHDVEERKRLATLRQEVATALADVHDLPEMLQRCAQALAQAFPQAVAQFWLRDSQPDQLCLRAAAGTEHSIDPPEQAVALGEGFVGSIAAQSRPTFTTPDQHALLSASDMAMLWEHHSRSRHAEQPLHAAGYPLVVDQKVTGVMVVGMPQPLPEALTEALSAMASGIAVGIDRKATQETLRRAREELEQRVRQRTLELGRVNAALRQSEDKWRLLADTIPQLAWVARPNGHVSWYNRRWYEYTGTTPQRVEGWGWQTVVDPQALPRVMELWKAALAAGTTFDTVIPLRGTDEIYRPFLSRANPLRDREGRVLFWFGTNTDITAQVEVEEALRRNERQQRFLSEVSAALVGSLHYQSILAQVAELAVPTLGDFCFFDVLSDDLQLQRVACKHIDPQYGELVNALAQYVPTRDTAEHPVAKAIHRGESVFMPRVTEAWLQSISLAPEHLELLRKLNLTSLITVPMTVGDRRLGAVTFCCNLPGHHHSSEELRLAEEIARRVALMVENVQLYEALQETDRRKDEFLATLAHELRNPLAPIRNSLQILKMPGVDADTIQHSRDLMERQVQHLVRLVDDLLDVSRVMRGKIELRNEAVDLATVVARAVETAQPLIDLQQHQLQISLPSEPLVLQADPIRLAQVVGNLLTNAAKYTERGGQIWLTVQHCGTEALLSVRDNGIGIAEETLPSIFALFVQVDPATTRSQSGLGIGLTLVKNLVELHGGTVSAHSEGIGRGTEVVVRLPLLDPTVSSPPALPATSPAVTAPDSAPAAAATAGHRLLVVDDNQDAANTLALLLRLQGHEVRVAHSGPEALQVLESYRPEMIFLDIGMPVMDGCEVARRVRQVPSLDGVVLTALTGWGQEEDRRLTAHAGFDHHLVKPPELAELTALLAALPRAGATGSARHDKRPGCHTGSDEQ